MATTEINPVQLPAAESVPDSVEFDLSRDWLKAWQSVRARSVAICEPLCVEDYVVQPCAEVSPPKWHLAHTTWFFEEAVLSRFLSNYRAVDEGFSRLFNSYYKSAGEHWLQGERGQLSRPTVAEVLAYRQQVDECMLALMQDQPDNEELLRIVELGLHHEQQHQELLYMDIKTILGSNPSMPAYREQTWQIEAAGEPTWRRFGQGLYEIGHSGQGFSYDNECPAHNVFLQDFAICDYTVSNRDYLEFMAAGGYEQASCWLSQGWDWVQQSASTAPMYWFKTGEGWQHYTLHGVKPVQPEAPLVHINYFEADAFARWAGYRLPTEAELEIWLNHQDRAPSRTPEVLHPTSVSQATLQTWCWTSSHYSPYPGYRPYAGMLGEYNGKFMCNQFVLRGGCVATPASHYRNSYRNFFLPQQRWMFSGIRLAGDQQ